MSYRFDTVSQNVVLFAPAPGSQDYRDNPLLRDNSATPLVSPPPLVAVPHVLLALYVFVAAARCCVFCVSGPAWVAQICLPLTGRTGSDQPDPALQRKTLYYKKL